MARSDAARRLAARVVRSWTLLPEVGGRPLEFSRISPPSPPTPGTEALVGELVRAAGSILDGTAPALAERFSDRMGTEEQRRTWSLWPGEHYALLTALAHGTGAVRAVEIGTFTGMGTLALLAGGVEHVTTVDLVPWSDFPDTVLRPSDLASAVDQQLVDLADPDAFARFLPTLVEADLVFIDGPKDWVFEPALFASLVEARSELAGTLFVVDDTRVMPLARTWLETPWDAIDATSLGHWSGTGLARMRPEPS